MGSGVGIGGGYYIIGSLILSGLVAWVRCLAFGQLETGDPVGRSSGADVEQGVGNVEAVPEVEAKGVVVHDGVDQSAAPKEAVVDVTAPPSVISQL